jgi:hypothetical protein
VAPTIACKTKSSGILESAIRRIGTKMKRLLHAIETVTAVVRLLLPVASANEAVCKPLKLKKVSRLRVSLINQMGASVPNATLLVFQVGKEIARGQTSENGKFSFDGLPQGSYQVRIVAAGYKEDQFPIILGKPTKNVNDRFSSCSTSDGSPAPGESGWSSLRSPLTPLCTSATFFSPRRPPPIN